MLLILCIRLGGSTRPTPGNVHDEAERAPSTNLAVAGETLPAS